MLESVSDLHSSSSSRFKRAQSLVADEWLYMGLLIFLRLVPFSLSHRHCLSVYYAVNRQRLQG